MRELSIIIIINNHPWKCSSNDADCSLEGSQRDIAITSYVISFKYIFSLIVVKLDSSLLIP